MAAIAAPESEAAAEDPNPPPDWVARGSGNGIDGCPIPAAAINGFMLKRGTFISEKASKSTNVVNDV